jgi:hypothetical protein
VLGGYLSLFYKSLVPVIKTLEILLFQFQENSESKNLQFQFFWVKKPQREPVLSGNNWQRTSSRLLDGS